MLTKNKLEQTDILARAKAVLETEAQSIQDLAARLDESFIKAVELMLPCSGRIVVIGMGKSGHIGKKMAATLASTGTPSFFVHPGEANHGDMGMITPNDVVLCLSNSGTTDELLSLIPFLKRLNIPLIAMTGNSRSPLASAADIHLDVSVAQEACPLGLAPTASTTVSLAMGDALAVALLEARGFTAEDFALSHPAGQLGRRLLLKIDDIMHTGRAIPQVAYDALLSDALLEMSAKGLGMTAIVDDAKHVLGIFTDGDLRRTLNQSPDLKAATIADAMTKNCATIRAGSLAVDALNLMESKKINGLLVVDASDRLVGALNMHDLLRAQVI